MKGAFLFFVALRLAVAAPQSAPDQQLCSIKGMVTDALTHQGLRKAYLRLGEYPAVTDDRGAFTIENIKPGTYPLTAEHQGFLDGEYGEADGADVEIKLTPGQTLTDINVKLTPQAVVSGRVLDEDGEAWTHAFVNLRRSRRVHGQRKIEDFGGGELNDQGEFHIGRIPPGKYFLSAEPDAGWEARYQLPAQQRQPTWYPSSLDLEGATPINLSAGSQLVGLEIRIRRGSTHRIRGTLLGVESIPPPDDALQQYGRRRISAQSTSGAGANGNRAVIRPDGSFEIFGLQSGTYEIHVSQGFPPIGLGTATVQVDDRDVEDVSMQLTPPQPVAGMIKIEEEGSKKLAGLQVELDPVHPGRSSYIFSRADGSFEFPPIAAERYRVSVGAIGHYLKEIRYGDAVSNDGTFTVTSAGGSLLLVLSTRVAHLTGQISTAGAPRIVLIPSGAGDEVRQATLDQTGAFSFGDLRPGTYKLYAFEGAPDGVWEDPDFVKEFSAAGVEIHLDEGETKSIDVTLIPKADLAPVLKKLGIE